MDLTVYGVLRSTTVDADVEVDFDGGTVEEALTAILDRYPGMEHHLYSEDGTLAPSVRILVDGGRVDLGDPCPADAHLQLHPMIQGG